MTDFMTDLSCRVADLFESLEQTPQYAVEAAKVRLTQQVSFIMLQQGITKAELARRLGTSRAYVTKLLMGSTNLTIDSIVKLSKALDCDLEIKLVNKESNRVWEQPKKAKVLIWRPGRKYTTPDLARDSKNNDAPLSTVA